MEKIRRNTVVYYLIQGIAVAAWWAVLIAKPETKAYFQLEPASQTSLMAFWLPDAVLIAAGSLTAAYLVFSRSIYATAAIWLVTGAVSYAAIYTFSYAMTTDAGWLGVVMMFPAMLWSGVFAVGLTVGNGMFRRAKDSSAGYVVFKTFAQIIVVWTLILVIFPYLITLIEDKLGIPQLEFAHQRPLAAVLFVLLSSIGVYAAVVMSRIGKGTPLPLDHATNLVVLGPYSYVRNPMAVSGIGQGLAVALFLGSPLVVVYALIGSAIWQFVFRPLEEDDLVARFGQSYEEYKGAVMCWVPRLRRYEVGFPQSRKDAKDGSKVGLTG